VWTKGRILTTAGIAVVILVGAGWLLRTQLQRHGAHAIAATPASHPVQSIRSLAILPFEPIPKNANNELLGLAMADAVIGRLSNTKQLSVFPTTTMLRYSARTDDPAAIAKALNTDAVLSGTIQRVGDRLRVTVQLSDGKSTLWSETFEETFTDVFTIQDSIANKLAQALTLELTQDEKQKGDKRFTRNPAAYDAYLVGLHLYNKRTRQELAHAIDHFRQAIEQDPNYGLAYALMADCYYLEGYYRFAPLDAAVTNARAAAEHALLLDDTIAEAHVAMAMV